MEPDRLRDELLQYARADARLSGIAITGSAALGHQDEWSDIDLAFGIGDARLRESVIQDFTATMYREHAALHHYDVHAGPWLYRIFFLPAGLQVDLAFVGQADFRPMGPAFRLILGEAGSRQEFPEPAAADLIGLAWLHALHVRGSIMRGRSWQAEYMISAVRDYTLALACLRFGLPSAHGRGMDRLPAEVTESLHDSLVRELNGTELRRAFAVVIKAFVHELTRADSNLAARVATELQALPEGW
jgi:hypothetical protein